MRLMNNVAFANIPYFFFRTLPDGRRQVSWRVWVLVFVAPVLFLLFGGYFTLQSLNMVSNYQRTLGEVVRVYDWDGNYSPVFEYEFRPGEMTQASTGQSSPNWNHPIGSRHEILYDPREKGDVKQDNFEQLWALPVTISAIGGVVLIPALIAAFFIRRWQKAGSETTVSP